MFEEYGIARVIEPKFVLPTTAWRVDNSRELRPKEVRIDIKRIHFEPTSFKQICLEAGNDDERIKEKIMDIVIRRGKLHNPVTDTGGLLCGVVSQIGSQWGNNKNLRPGEEVICNASLAGIPIYLSRITKIDRAYTQIEAEGYAIIFDKVPLIRRPVGAPLNLLLFAFNESGTLFSVSTAVNRAKNCLITGNNMMMNLLFGYVTRRAAGPGARIVCLFDKKTEVTIRGETFDKLMEYVFDEIHYANVLRPTECLEKLNIEGAFDVAINCADILGAETVNVLAAKTGGTVIFANMINNYNIALYITEAISRQLSVRCAEGYLEKYDEFDIEIVKELAPYLENVETISAPMDRDDENHGQNRIEAYGGRGSYVKALAEEFVCESRAMSRVLDEILSVAKYDCNVLITGDTGVGKEKVANIIQKNSTRRMQAFVKVNCAAISPNLIESELFGYEKGSFTGAAPEGKKGYFEQADSGIIFLDEVGELPLDVQAKLLRVTQDGEFFRVGGTTPVKTNVRIISATNRDLERQIEERTFRRDLYYRLNVFPVKVPSLEERCEEIPALVNHFLRAYSQKFGEEVEMEREALEYLQRSNWPGNVRQLENAVQRIIISAKSGRISLVDVMKAMDSRVLEGVDIDIVEGDMIFAKEVSLAEMVDSFEKNIIKYACETHGSTRKAAKAIGISQTQLVRKKKKYQL